MIWSHEVALNKYHIPRVAVSCFSISSLVTKRIFHLFIATKIRYKVCSQVSVSSPFFLCSFSLYSQKKITSLYFRQPSDILFLPLNESNLILDGLSSSKKEQ